MTIITPHLNDCQDTLALIDEHIANDNQISDIYWNKLIGKDVDDSKIAELGETAEILARKIVAERFVPQDVYLSFFFDTRASKFIKQYIALKNFKNEGFTCGEVTYKGSPVNRNNWYPWLRSPEAVSDDRRKKVFDAFINKVPKYRLLLEQLQATHKEVLAELGMGFEELFPHFYGSTLDELQAYLERLLEKLSPYLTGIYHELTRGFYNRDPEYYDDTWTLYYAASRSFNDKAPEYGNIDRVLSFFNETGYDLSNVTIDTEQREKKFSNPFCFPVKRPSDVRVSVHGKEGYYNFKATMHEMGHALHAVNIDPALPGYKRYHGFKDLFIEVPSELIGEYLCSLPSFRSAYPGELPAGSLEAFKRWKKAGILQQGMCAAITLAKIQLVKKDSFDAVTEEFQRLLNKHFGIPLPGEFWYLAPTIESWLAFERHLYSMGVVMALVRELEEKHGDNWWKNPAAHGSLRARWSRGNTYSDGLPPPDPDAHVRWLLENAGLE